MSRRGNCWDNAVAESFFHSLKTELVADCRFESRAQAAGHRGARLHQGLLQLMAAAFDDWLYNADRVSDSSCALISCLFIPGQISQ